MRSAGGIPDHSTFRFDLSLSMPALTPGWWLGPHPLVAGLDSYMASCAAKFTRAMPAYAAYRPDDRLRRVVIMISSAGVRKLFKNFLCWHRAQLVPFSTCRSVDRLRYRETTAGSLRAATLFLSGLSAC